MYLFKKLIPSKSKIFLKHIEIKNCFVLKIFSLLYILEFIMLMNLFISNVKPDSFALTNDSRELLESEFECCLKLKRR